MTCGDSFTKTITVTGKLPGKNWGSQYKAVLKPIAAASTLGPWGYDDTNERHNIALLQQFNNALTKEIFATKSLRTSESEKLRALVTSSVNLLERIRGIYEPWEQFLCMSTLPEAGICPWPLSVGDEPKTWLPACDGKATEIVLDGNGKARVCPYDSVTAERKQDRTKIRLLVIEAFRFSRCAQYWLTKWKLWVQAKATYKAPVNPTTWLGPSLPGGPVVPTPGVTVGGFGTYKPPLDPKDIPGPNPLGPVNVPTDEDPEDEDVWPTLPLPEPDAQPSPDSEEPPSASDLPPDAEEPGTSSGTSSGTKTALVAAGVGLLLLLIVRS
jgi:hypothetical protein